MSLTSFYLNQSPDHARRLLADIHAFSLEQLESTHDFIQWLFPLETKSPVNPLAPTLDLQTISEFRSTPLLQQNMLRSLDLMLHFYGLQRKGDMIHLPSTQSKLENRNSKIVTASNFPNRSPIYLHPNNHNHLRLTRILHSLSLCGLTNEAAALLACLQQIAQDHPHAITPATLRFWQSAP
jgi:hypothetical protein